MCAALELNTRVLRPGKWVPVWSKSGALQLIWAGFARREMLHWWEKKGGELVDVPADRFAERSDKTRALIWDRIPEGQVVRGLIEKSGPTPLLKIVTRASTEAELARFQHPRMPLIEAPLFSSAAAPAPESAPAGDAREDRQTWLL
jgi:hypothetical protein